MPVPPVHPAHRPRRRLASRFAAVAATALIALGGVVATPAPARAATGYVALGDSFSSGVGTREYYADGTGCDRSRHAFPALLASANALDLTFAACSGATTADVTAEQLASLRSTTSRVSITVGGNDAGFVPVLTECAKPSWWGDCDAAINTALGVIDNQLPGRLSALYRDIARRAPHATVAVAGYPRLFNGEDCNAATFFSPAEERRLNAAADRLNAVIRRHATAAGFRYADPVPAFVGHAVCDDVEWVNGLSFPIPESYHPNRAGHRGYAAVVAPALRVWATSSATAAAVRLPHARARSERVHAPDLNSATARRAARNAGISPADLDRLVAAQRAGASNAELEVLNSGAVRRAQARPGR